MSLPVWQRRLDAASSEADVVATARDFVAMLSPSDLDRLPEPCRPGPLERGSDVADFASILVRHHCSGDGATHRLVDRLIAFFSAAARRLAELQT